MTKPVEVRRAIFPEELLVWESRVAAVRSADGEFFRYTNVCCATEHNWKACNWSPSLEEIEASL